MKKKLRVVLDKDSLIDTVHFYDEELDDSIDYMFSISGDTVHMFIDDSIFKLLKRYHKLSFTLEIQAKTYNEEQNRKQ